MKILVIEDKVEHQESARETLKGHELTVLSSFDEYMGHERDVTKQLMRGRGWSDMPYPCYWPKEKTDAYWAAWKECETEAKAQTTYDVVLTDLHFPMSRHQGHTGPLSKDQYDPSQQIPYGWIIALHAAGNGAKYVALLTDVNHHKGALSSAMDALGPTYYREGKKPDFVINGATCMFVHAPFVRTTNGKDPKLKDWGQVLKDLTAP